MGRILFIRVSAETYDEKDVLKTWPKLYASVWPDPGVDAEDSPSKITRKMIPARERGVLELVDGFVEYVRFGDMSEMTRKGLQSGADKLERLRGELDEALGNRDVQNASSLTNTIEDTLDEAEKAARES